MMNASPAPQEIFLLKLGEVVLKGQNRQSFEDKLLANVRRRVKNCGSFQCSLRQSTIYVEPQGEDCDMEAAWDACRQVFGIAAVARAVPCEKTVDAIVEAGLYAPSAKNLQSTKLVVVRDAAVLARLERLNSRILGTPEGTPFYGAPEAIVVLSDSDYPNWLQDGSLVMGNLMNAAAALGVGSCWINRAMETFELPEGKALLAEWGLGENWKGVGNCILGYTDQAVLGDKARKEDRVLYV